MKHWHDRKLSPRNVQKNINMKSMIDALRINSMSENEIQMMLSVSPAAVRGYIRIAMHEGAVEVETPYNKEAKTYTIYCIANDLAARSISGDAKKRVYVAPAKKLTPLQRRIAECATQGRRIIHNGEENDILKIDPVRPAFRCDFESMFFGPARAAA